MDEFVMLLVILAIVAIVSGPIALVVALIALKKTHQLEEKRAWQPPAPMPPVPRPVTTPTPAPAEPTAPQPPKQPEEPKTPASPYPAQAYIPAPAPVRPPTVEPFHKPAPPAGPPQPELSFEQRFGTRWLLVAGIVSVIVAAGYFLKYAYDHDWLGPWMRVAIVAAGGAAGLVIGESTRRRGYDVVARGTTALGFALLYAASFSAYRVYDLVSPLPAFTAAVLITLAAMTYAAVLDEVLIAFLSLAGGYLTPILVSTGRNLPIPLFSYILVLSLGAMLIAYLRRWRSVNITAFVGTYLIYLAWFLKFCAPVLDEPEWGQHKPVALFWLAVFFVVYLLMPLMYGILRKVKARPEDVTLVPAAGLVTVAFLWSMLYESGRTELAIWCAGIGAVYLAVMALVRRRCPEDEDLRSILLVVGIGFLTAAAAFYWTQRPLVIAWAVEGAILTFLGIRLSNRLLRALSVVVLGLAVGGLLYWLTPLHGKAFTLVRNPAFGTWIFVAAAVLAGHFFWRFARNMQPEERRWTTDLFYTAALALAAFACFSELYFHCRFNVIETARNACLHRGVSVMAAVLIALLLIRPLCPRGSTFGPVMGILAVVAASVFVVVSLAEVYNKAFLLFLNAPFLLAMLIPLSILAVAWRMGRQEGLLDEYKETLIGHLGLLAAGLIWVLLTEEVYLYWQSQDRFAGPVPNWRFLANLSVSILWAVYAAVLILIGFLRKNRAVRYAALALFTLLLGKIFLYDTVSLATGYRIAAFLVTGLVLLAVSYLYQYARKRGIFENLRLNLPLEDKKQ